MVEDVVTMQVWIKSFWCQSNAINKLQNSNFRNYQWWLPNNLPEVIRLKGLSIYYVIRYGGAGVFPIYYN